MYPKSLKLESQSLYNYIQVYLMEKMANTKTYQLIIIKIFMEPPTILNHRASWGQFALGGRGAILVYTYTNFK